ncbi:MAG TPA: Calx-beta domain-containing protein [Pyrinomonadaceae bacterium]
MKMKRSRVALLLVILGVGLLILQRSSRPVAAQLGVVPLVIIEFRLRGPNGPNDEFIEIYNNSDFAHVVNSVDGSASGYALVGSSNSIINDNLPATRFVIPNGTVIPARGHYLATNSNGYSLGNYPAGAPFGGGNSAQPNITYTIQIPDNSGIALFGTSVNFNFNFANRVDAVGSSSDTNALYREGVGYPAIPQNALEGSFFRRFPGGCTGSLSGNCNTIALVTTTLGPTSSYPQDTDNNANDFLYGDVSATDVGVSRRLSTPGPENLFSPVTGTLSPGLVVSRIDSTVPEDAAPNRIRNTTPGSLQNSTFGTVTFRRRFTNNTGQSIARLRFRVIDITTLPSIGSGCNVEPAPAGCAADLRTLSAVNSVVSTNDPSVCGSGSTPCNVTAFGASLEGPPIQNFGGGFNSSWSADNITTAAPLLNGASINLQFVAGLQQTGADRLYVLVEALPRSGPATTAVVRLAGPVAGSAFQFDQAVYSVQEDITSTVVTVRRSGNINTAASVDFATADGTATQRQDFTIARGTLNFAAGETTKTITILVNEDSKTEGTESFSVNLSNPTGNAVVDTLGSTTIQIIDDVAEPATNVNDDPATFIGQHYHDFLHRQPDTAGLNFWTNTITSCGADQDCIQSKRINASAAFFLSIEFQETSFFVLRLQRVAFGRKSETAATRFGYLDFVKDARRVGNGVVIGEAGAEQQLETNKQSYATDIVTSAAFIVSFPLTLTASQFVDALAASATITLTASERQAAIDAFGAGGTAGRVAALRSVADSATLKNAEFNPAFVLLQYYGYLRRNPTDAPDVDDSGYQFWLNKLNQFNGNFVAAEMVKAFLLSGEYRDRFAP